MSDLFGSNRPPSPDPGNCIWVKSREGGHWRRRRGLVKKAELNTSYNRSRENTSISSPAAKRILAKLQPHFNGIASGRRNAWVSGRLRKALNKNGKLDFSFMKDLDFQQRDHPMGRLLLVMPKINVVKGSLTVEIPIADYTLKKHNQLVTDFYFELILLYGNAAKQNGLRIESETSDVYPIEPDSEQTCRFNMVIPKSPWMAVLKVTCIEEDTPAVAPRNYAMKVICVNND